jgi:putative transposase
MPRRARIAVAHYPHHLVQRGHNRRAVFVTDRDRLTYLETLREFRAELGGLKIYGYCLMTNHVHLIVDPGDDSTNLGLLMKRLAGRHARRINRLERRTGTSWEGRFKCSPIESDRYLLACTTSRRRAEWPRSRKIQDSVAKAYTRLSPLARRCATKPFAKCLTRWA